MAIPDFQTLMRPILAQLQDGQPRAIADVRAALVSEFALTEEDLAQELPSGRAKTFQNRVGWVTTHLYRTGLLMRPRRSVYAITERGQQVLAANPERIDLRVLAQFPELAAFRSARQDEHQPEQSDQTLVAADDLGVHEATPQERIASAYRELRSALIAELLDSISEQDSDFLRSSFSTCFRLWATAAAVRTLQNA